MMGDGKLTKLLRVRVKVSYARTRTVPKFVVRRSLARTAASTVACARTPTKGMATRDTAELLTGVVEGFYGKPWTHGERTELFEWMAEWGLNTYLYAPKDDLKHRAIWREL